MDGHFRLFWFTLGEGGTLFDFLAKEAGGKLGELVLPFVKHLWLEAKMKSE